MQTDKKKQILHWFDTDLHDMQHSFIVNYINKCVFDVWLFCEIAQMWYYMECISSNHCNRNSHLHVQQYKHLFATKKIWSVIEFQFYETLSLLSDVEILIKETCKTNH